MVVTACSLEGRNLDLCVCLAADGSGQPWGTTMGTPTNPDWRAGFGRLCQLGVTGRIVVVVLAEF